MRAIFVVLLLAIPAHAGSKLVLLGAGNATVDEAPGWIVRAEARLDFNDTDDEPHLVFGNSFAVEAWSAGEHEGFAVPVGWYAGAQVGHARTTLGVGFTVWAYELTKTPAAKGIAPFANATLEATAGKLAISLDGRIARQVLLDTEDFNVYSVLVMLGRRWR